MPFDTAMVSRVEPRLGVMQVVDTLRPGGLERVAVNIANALPAQRYVSFICATRAEGPLGELVAPRVTKINLRRSGRFDIGAILRLSAVIRTHGIGLLHAHGSSLFISVAASLLPPFPTVIWHDHFGAAQIASRPALIYRLALQRVAAVIAVNPLLGRWSRSLGVAAERVHYIPNFVLPPTSLARTMTLPGNDGSRVICVAQLRPQKDHATLLQAWSIVRSTVPGAHLFLVGGGSPERVGGVAEEIHRLGLREAVTMLGERSDVTDLLRQCDVGVLSSASEGFPLALLEYGTAGLAAVATDVGQCSEVLDHGRAGLIVPSRDAESLAAALVALLGSPATREALAGALRRRAAETYSVEAIIARICSVYDRHSGPRGVQA